MQRKGFTMIELIFVIVILGILAAVAIPKLAATRDDAKISKGLSELSTAISDFGAYYTANGRFDNNISNMTNVSSFSGSLTNNAGTVTYQVPDNSGKLANCVDFTFATNGDLTIATNANADTGNVCQGIIKSTTYKKDIMGTKHFGGSRVSF